MTTIKFKDGRVMLINYHVVDMPVRFEKRGRRFKSAWTIE